MEAATTAPRHQGLRLDISVQSFAGTLKGFVFEVTEVNEEGLSFSSRGCPAMLVDLHLQGLEHAPHIHFANLLLPPDSSHHKSFLPHKVLKNESILFKIHVRALAFNNIKLIAKTDREIADGLRSGRTSFLRVRSEEDYYDKRARINAERAQKLLEMNQQSQSRQ